MFWSGREWRIRDSLACISSRKQLKPVLQFCVGPFSTRNVSYDAGDEPHILNAKGMNLAAKSVEFCRKQFSIDYSLLRAGSVAGRVHLSYVTLILKLLSYLATVSP